MVSPLCEVKDGAGAYQPTAGGVDVTSGNTITIHLIDTSASTWTVSCTGTDENNVAATITSGLTIDSVARTATFTAPAAGSALIFTSIVNGGVGVDGVAVSSYTTTFAIHVKTAGGKRVIAVTEKLESNSSFGWVAQANSMIRGTVSSNDRKGNVYQLIGRASAVDATATTIATFSMADETAIQMEVTMVAVRTAAVTKAETYKRFVSYRRTGGGAPTIIGSATATHTAEVDAAADITFVVSGNDIQVKFTGVATNNWDVYVAGTVTEMRLTAA